MDTGDTGVTTPLCSGTPASRRSAREATHDNTSHGRWKRQRGDEDPATFCECVFDYDGRWGRPMSTPALVANVLPVRFTFESIDLLARDIVEGEELGALRDSLAPDWSVQWEGGRVYFLRLGDGDAELPDTMPTALAVGDNLRLLARLTTDALVRRFPTYEPLRRKPFTFIGRKHELMEDVGKLLGVEHPLLHDFRIWPKYSLDARVVEVIAGSPFVGVTVDLATRWEITADLEELQRAGVDLTGLFVVRRNPEPELRPLVGRIGTVHDGVVKLSESTTETESVRASSVMVEGRREAFARCLRRLLGAKFRDTRNTGTRRWANSLVGHHCSLRSSAVANVLGERPIELAQGLMCSVGGPLRITNSPDYRSIVSARQLDYCFDAARTKRHRLAWPGLETYGPFSRDTFARPSPNILVVFPQAAQGAVEKFVRYLRDGIPGQTAYQAGLTKTFGLVNPRFEMVAVPPSQDRTPGEQYRHTIEGALSKGGRARCCPGDRHGPGRRSARRGQPIPTQQGHAPHGRRCDTARPCQQDLHPGKRPSIHPPECLYRAVPRSCEASRGPSITT